MFYFPLRYLFCQGASGGLRHRSEHLTHRDTSLTSTLSRRFTSRHSCRHSTIRRYPFFKSFYPKISTTILESLWHFTSRFSSIFSLGYRFSVNRMQETTITVIPNGLLNTNDDYGYESDHAIWKLKKRRNLHPKRNVVLTCTKSRLEFSTIKEWNRTKYFYVFYERISHTLYCESICKNFVWR